MKLISWNCRGLRKFAAVIALLELQMRLKPDILFLSETHLNRARAENLRRRLCFDHMIVAESDGRSGGLLLLWKKDVKISLRFKGRNFIDVNVEHGLDYVWRFTGLYGEPRWQDKHLT